LGYDSENETISFLVYYKQYMEFLEKIREIGVLHVIEKPEGIAENDNLREKMLLAARIKTALKQLENGYPKIEYKLLWIHPVLDWKF